MSGGFRDRQEAGELLAERLTDYLGRPGALVLGLPRGGAVVAAAVAARLRLPLDLMVVRKLGVPGQEEFAMGAIAPGAAYLNRELISALGIPRATVDEVVAREEVELRRREQLYRAGRGPLQLKGKDVLLVDDGLATGSTMRAAVASARRGNPSWISVAVPVGAPASLKDLAREADEIVCPIRPASLQSVGEWYERFGQVSDEEVIRLLQSEGAGASAGGGAGGPRPGTMI